MATVAQILAVSYAAVVTEARKPANQWSENAFMREMERQGMIVRKAFGSTLEETLDIRRNPNAKFLSSDLDPYSLDKTDVLSAAVYDIAEIVAPIVWSNKDEVMNPSENQKVALVKNLALNGLETHDDMVEEALFSLTTEDFHGLLTLVPNDGQGTVGTIDAGTEVFWRNPNNQYADETDIEVAMTTTWNQCAKGSGSKMSPTLIVSDGATQAIFEGTQQANQRWVDTDELKAGFKVLAFKTARYVFSQYGDDNQYFVNPKNFRLLVSSSFFRERGETAELPNATGKRTTIYSACQLVTNNKSRLGVNHI